MSPRSWIVASQPVRVAAAFLVGLLGLALVFVLVGRVPHGPHPRPITARVPPSARIVPPPPVVAPPAYADMTPDQARADNATVPFAGVAVVPARPFVYAGTVEDRVAARTCLAAAVLYEAGDDRAGETAVAQVVLNRLRHPAFPKTVCGVVFQGAERATGCQFTFACDGALNRPPRPDAWQRAVSIADAALSGSVAKAVGTATHYHTDWVVPYWRASLAKLAEVHTQIFYRWPGWWGTPAAFTGRPQPFERMDPRIVALAGPEQTLALLDALLDALPDGPPVPLVPRTVVTIDGVPARALAGATVRLKDEQAAQYVVQFDPDLAPARFAMIGFTICADKPDCLVLGWTSKAETPRALPVLPVAMRSIAFLYRKSSVIGTAAGQWDCRRYPRPGHGQCLAGSGR